MKILRRTIQILSVLVVAVVLISAIGGRGSRGQFEPYSLTSRKQTEWLLPIVNVPLYRSNWKESQTYILCDFLIAEGYWESGVPKHPRYIDMYHWNAQWRDGQSELYVALNMHSDRWIAFTREHPTAAAKLWPKVLEELRVSREPSQVINLMREALLEAEETRGS